MKSLTISKRIWLLALQFTALVVFVGGFGAWNTVRLSRELDELGHIHLVATRDMTLVDMYHDGLAAKVYKSLEYATQRNTEALAETKKEFEEMSKEMTTTILDLKGLALSAGVLTLIDEAQKPVENYILATTSIVNAATANDRKLALSHMPEFEATFGDLEMRFEKLGESIEGGAKDKVAIATEHSASMQRWNFLMIAFGVVAGIVMAWFFIRDIFQSLNRIAGAVAAGSERLVESSVEINEAATTLAESTTEQSSAIEETVSSMEEMGSMIAQTSQNADVTTKEAEGSVREAQEGKHSVGNMVRAMGDIANSNERLQAIVTVIEDIKNKTKIINDIAFETRLLAFNASIEAARAGAHGRGFAVVAEEVGKLANVSGKAADEVRALLDNSVTQVTTIVNDTRKKITDGQATSSACESAFAKMEASVGNITQGIQRITAATKEQETGVRQTNKAMVEMEKVTQSNSRGAENLSTSAAELRHAADALRLNAKDMQRLVLGRGDVSESRDSTRSDSKGGGNSKQSRDINKKPKAEHQPALADKKETSPQGSSDLEAIDRNDSRWHAA